MSGGILIALTDPEFRARAEKREAERQKREAIEAARAEAEAAVQAEMARHERYLASECEAHLGELIVKADVSPEASRRFIETFRQFAQWCEMVGVPCLPTAGSTVATFLFNLWKDGKSLGVIRRMARAIEHVHDLERHWLDRAYINAAVERISELRKTVH